MAARASYYTLRQHSSSAVTRRKVIQTLMEILLGGALAGGLYLVFNLTDVFVSAFRHFLGFL